VGCRHGGPHPKPGARGRQSFMHSLDGVWCGGAGVGGSPARGADGDSAGGRGPVRLRWPTARKTHRKPPVAGSSSIGSSRPTRVWQNGRPGKCLPQRWVVRLRRTRKTSLPGLNKNTPSPPPRPPGHAKIAGKKKCPPVGFCRAVGEDKPSAADPSKRPGDCSAHPKARRQRLRRSG